MLVYEEHKAIHYAQCSYEKNVLKRLMLARPHTSAFHLVHTQCTSTLRPILSWSKH